MLGPSWIALFQRIPVKYHDSLALTMATGSEILLQSVLRLESDFTIMRGRMSGSTDAGRVLIIPYDQILNVAFTKRMLEPEVQEIFGDLMAAPSAASEGNTSNAAVSTAESATASATAAADTSKVQNPGNTSVSPTPPPAQPAAAGAAKNAPPSKSILLARLRARLAEQGK